MDAAGIGNSMAEFQKVFEDMDIKTAEMDGVMEDMYQGSISQDEVSNLLGEIKDQ